MTRAPYFSVNTPRTRRPTPVGTRALRSRSMLQGGLLDERSSRRCTRRVRAAPTRASRRRAAQPAGSARGRGEHLSEVADLRPVRSREQLLFGLAQRQERHALNGVEGRHRQGQVRLGFRASCSGRFFDQRRIEFLLVREQRAERSAVGQQCTKSDVALLLLVGGQRGVRLGDIGEEPRVLRVGGLGCPQRCRRRGSGPKDCRAENRHRKAETERTADAAQSHSHSRHVASVTHDSRRPVWRRRDSVGATPSPP